MEIYSQINTLRTWRWAEKGIARAAEVRDDYKAQGHRDTGTQGHRDTGTQGRRDTGTVISRRRHRQHPSVPVVLSYK